MLGMAEPILRSCFGAPTHHLPPEPETEPHPTPLTPHTTTECGPTAGRAKTITITAAQVRVFAHTDDITSLLIIPNFLQEKDLEG